MSEVKRILEIMGYEIGKPINEQKKIILESYLRKFTDEMADLLINISNKSNIVIGDLINNGSELTYLKSFQDLKDKLNSWSETQGKSFYEQIQILKSKIDNSGDEPLFIGHVRLTDDEAKVWDDLLNNAWVGIINHVDKLTELYTRLSWWRVLNNQAEKTFELITKIDLMDIKALTRDELNDLKVKVDDLIKYFGSYNVTYPYGKFKSDMIDGLTNAKNLLKPKNNFVKKGFKEVIKNFWESIAVKRINNPEFDDFVSDLIRYWDQWTKSRSTKISEMEKLEKELLELAEKGEYSESKMIRYQELLFSTKEEFTSSVKSYLNSPEIKKFISDDMRKMLDTNERYLRWIEEADKHKTAIPIWTAAGEEGLAWIKTLNVLIVPNFFYTIASKMKSSNKDVSYWKLFWKNYREGLMRTASAALTTSPRLPSEIISLKNKLGSGGWALAGSLVVHNGLANMVIPYYVAFFEVFYHTMIAEPLEVFLQIFADVNLHNYGLDDDPEALNFIDENGEFKYMDYAIYQLNKRAYGSDFAESFKNFGVEDVLGTNDKSAFEGIFLRWSYVDELFRRMVKFGTGGGSNEQVRREQEGRREDLIHNVEEVLNDTDSLQNNIRNEVDTLTNQVRDQIEDVITPDDDENDNQNGGGGNGQQVLPGLEGEMKTAFNNWANSNSNRRPEWVSFSGNVGLVKIDGDEKQLVKTSTGKYVITPTTPLIILN